MDIQEDYFGSMNNMEKPPEENKPWDWKEYYGLLEDKGHTKYLETAVTDYCKEKGEALDVGAGNLRDTKYLLEQGFVVTAVDPSPVSVELANELNNKSLIMLSEPIGKIDFEENRFSLVNAQGILFHLPEPRFSFVLEKIKKSLKTDGVLCADFIGENDDWSEGDKVIMSRQKLEELFNDFDIKYLKEYEADESQETTEKKAKYKNDPNYKPKHWHHVDVIAVKK